MIEASTDPAFAARLVAKARAIAEAHAERHARQRRGDLHRWRSARLLWPLFTKG